MARIMHFWLVTPIENFLAQQATEWIQKSSQPGQKNIVFASFELVQKSSHGSTAFASFELVQKSSQPGQKIIV
jgi:hypothetical protein